MQPLSIDDIAARVGNRAALARELGLTKAAVYAWRRVPSDRVIAVERVTGIPRELLRPDLYIREPSAGSRD